MSAQVASRVVRLNGLMRLAAGGSAAVLLVAVLGFAFLVRPWYLRWGATDAEVQMPLPGDSLIPEGAVVSTRAATIHAPAAVVWRWLVQVGQGRAGFYSYDWLENLFAADMHNSGHLRPELQRLQVGDHVSLQRNGPFAVVMAIQPGQALVLDGGWTFLLSPVDADTTRLIVRYAFDVSTLGAKLYYYSIFEPAHFVMESGMMLGLKQRAEAQG